MVDLFCFQYLCVCIKVKDVLRNHVLINYVSFFFAFSFKIFARTHTYTYVHINFQSFVFRYCVQLDAIHLHCTEISFYLNNFFFISFFFHFEIYKFNNRNVSHKLYIFINIYTWFVFYHTLGFLFLFLFFSLTLEWSWVERIFLFLHFFKNTKIPKYFNRKPHTNQHICI